MRQRLLFPIPTNDPDAPLPVNQYWTDEIANYIEIEANVHGRKLAVEDAMREMKLRADGPDVAPVVGLLLSQRGLRIVGEKPSQRPSRHRSKVHVWGKPS